MRSRLLRRFFICIGSVVGALLLISLHRDIDPTIFAAIRISLLLALVLLWRQVVDGLIASGMVHPMRRASVIGFRWRLLVLIAILEFFVIQQIPALLLAAISD